MKRSFLNHSPLMLDKLSFTFPVKSRKKREAIHHELQGYSHKGVETRYVRNHITDYHDTMKFTVRYKGKTFTLFISYNPLDQGTGNLKTRNFLRVECNPASAGQMGMWIIFKILTTILGSTLTRAIYHNAKTTRVDLTVDLYGTNRLYYLLSSTARNSRMVSVNSLYPTQYVGSENSRRQVRYYYKTEEQLMKGVDTPRKNVFRLEVQLRSVGSSLAELSEVLVNPFTKIKFYDAESVDSDRELSSQFKNQVKKYGPNKALYTHRSVLNAAQRLNQRDHRKELLAPHLVNLFDPREVWDELPAALSVLDAFDCLDEAA